MRRLGLLFRLIADIQPSRGETATARSSRSDRHEVSPYEGKGGGTVRKLVILALLAAVVAAVTAASAAAKPRGTNGLISFTRFEPALQQDVVYTINPDGSGLTEISTPRAPLTDDFNDNYRDPFWHVIQDPGSSINETNGRVEIQIAGDAPSNQVDAHYGSNCSLPGDFDAQVDYSLLQWPQGDGAFAALSGFFIGAFVSRHSDPFAGDRYTAFSNPFFAALPTSDLAGSLRLVRTGATLNAYVKGVGSDWILILSAPANPGDAVVGFGLSTVPDQWGHHTVQVAYDNFRLNSGALSCPSWWRDNAPNWQPLP